MTDHSAIARERTNIHLPRPVRELVTILAREANALDGAVPALYAERVALRTEQLRRLVASERGDLTDVAGRNPPASRPAPKRPRPGTHKRAAAGGATSAAAPDTPADVRLDNPFAALAGDPGVAPTLGKR